MRTAVTLCSGGGGSALGIQAADVQCVGAVEQDAAIAAQYAANLGAHVTVARVQDVDYRQFYGVDVLQESAPCPNFSNAKQGGEESPDDLAIAAACCRAIREIRPRYFWLENVEGYAGSQSYRLIRATLDDLDYWSHAAVVNAADFGVAQTRRRLIVRAVAGGLWQPFHPLPNAVPWVGWYAAVADLLDTLPETQPAPWQLKRLPAWLTQSALFGNQQSDDRKGTELGYGVCYRVGEQPALTVRTGVANIPRAFIMDCQNNGRADGDGNRGLTIPDSQAPMFTVTGTQTKRQVRAFVLSGHSDGAIRQADEPMVTLTATDIANTVHRAWLTQGRWVKMTPRALARFQSFDDAYLLPSNNALACKCIGNAVPPLLSRRITESLLI